VILLDTHIWVWWVSQPDRLQPRHREILDLGPDRAFGVSIISCWEVAKLVEYGRLKLDRSVVVWIESALAEPGVLLLHLSPRSSWSPPNCRNPSIAIRPTNCSSRRHASWSVLS